MDPLSITTAAVGFAAMCVSLTREIKDVFSRLRDAPRTLIDLERGIAFVSTMLPEIEEMLQANPFGMFYGMPRWRENQITVILEGCQETLRRLRLELEGVLKSEKWAMRASAFWNEESICRMVSELEVEKRNLHFIISILSMRSINNLSTRLSASLSGPETCLPQYHREATNLDNNTTLIERTPSRESSPSSTEFQFDDEIVNSRAYRDALAKLSRRQKRRLSSGGDERDKDFGSRGSPQSAAVQRRVLGDVTNSVQRTTFRDQEQPNKKRRLEENSFDIFEDSLGVFEEDATDF